MRCDDCKYKIYFGDMELYYCDVTLRLIHKNDECNCEKEREERLKDDEVCFPWQRRNRK